MSEEVTSVVSGDESALHDEPHLRGRRITVRYVHDRVEERGLDPETVADRHDLSLASVYHALAYYHEHPEEMAAVEDAHDEAASVARARSTMSPDDG